MPWGMFKSRFDLYITGRRDLEILFKLMHTRVSSPEKSSLQNRRNFFAYFRRTGAKARRITPVLQAKGKACLLRSFQTCCDHQGWKGGIHVFVAMESPNREGVSAFYGTPRNLKVSKSVEKRENWWYSIKKLINTQATQLRIRGIDAYVTA